MSIDLCASDDEPIAAVQPAHPGRRSVRIAKRDRKPDEAVLLHFPDVEAKERITLTYADARRLKSGARGAAPETLLLNDNLVDFYVKYLLSAPRPSCEKFIPGLSADKRARIHIFNAFFLKRLRMNLRKGLGLESMLKWVRHVDLLDKDYLFVPVHETRCHGHWSLAVICFPGHVTKANSSSIVAPADSEHAGETKVPAATESLPPRGAPCILFFDSFLVNTAKELFSLLRQFLECYWTRHYQEHAIDGHPQSGQPLQGDMLPPPIHSPLIPPPRPPARGKRSKGGACAGNAVTSRSLRRATRSSAPAATDEQVAAVRAASERAIAKSKRSTRAAGSTLASPVDADMALPADSVVSSVDKATAPADPLAVSLDGLQSADVTAAPLLAAGSAPLLEGCDEPVVATEEYNEMDDDDDVEDSEDECERGYLSGEGRASPILQELQEPMPSEQALEAVSSDESLAGKHLAEQAAEVEVLRGVESGTDHAVVAGIESRIGQLESDDTAKEVDESGPKTGALAVAPTTAATSASAISLPPSKHHKEQWFTKDRIPGVILRKVGGIMTLRLAPGTPFE